MVAASVAVAAGAAVGAPARYFLDRAVQLLHNTRYPWGTTVVNLVGSFTLGVLVGSGLAHAGSLTGELLATGLCSTMTTFSTLSYQTVRMFENGRRWQAAVNLVGSVVVGTAAVAAGFALGG
ncbi:MAG: CrcB family protein [Actinomycetota bacterium]|nr:CrcB family protein [Actinomycetota bacterium]